MSKQLNTPSLPFTDSDLVEALHEAYDAGSEERFRRMRKAMDGIAEYNLPPYSNFLSNEWASSFPAISRIRKTLTPKEGE